MSSPIITVENLSKAYRIGVADEKYDTLAATVASWVKAPLRNFKRLSRLNTTASLPAAGTPLSDTHWALRDVSFDVHEGEVVGIIGRNGAGKSTLLKILSRITDPTLGRAVIRGRVSSLLEVGTGFHPELSGRDNVYMNGTILGMRKKEIDQKFDEIVAFSGVEKFIDTPVKRYSSGMKVRLAFAVAAHLEPEILIIDEVLAVGDQEFQNRCLGKMGEVASGGRTVLFVSHNMAAVEGLCRGGIVLEHGSLVYNGSAQQAINHYSSGHRLAFLNNIVLENHKNRVISKSPLLSGVNIQDMDGNPLPDIFVGLPVVINLKLKPEKPVHQACVGIHFINQHGQRVATCHSAYQSRLHLNLSEPMSVTCIMQSCQLMPGDYNVVIAVAAGAEQIDRIDPAFAIRVMPRDFYGTGKLPTSRDGVFLPDARWEFDFAGSQER